MPVSTTGGGESVSTGTTGRERSDSSSPVVVLGALEFSEASRRVSDALRARGYSAPVAFRSPPKDPTLDRSLTRYEGSTVVAVRLRGRDRADALRDLCTGAVVAVLGTVNEAFIEELLVLADPPEPKPEPVAYTGTEEPF